MNVCLFFALFLVATIASSVKSDTSTTSILNFTTASGDFSTETTADMEVSGEEPTSSITSISSTTSVIVILPTSEPINPAEPCAPENNFCKDGSTFCEIVDGSPTCSCRPGFYFSSSSTCEKALNFGGKLYLEGTVRFIRAAANPEQEVLDLLDEAYSSSEGFIAVDVVGEYPENVWNYELFFDSSSGASETGIATDLGNYFEGHCGTMTICEIGTLRVKTAESVENAGSADDVVCQSYTESYCDGSSTACVVNEGFPTCECKANHVVIIGNDRFCAVKICDSDTKCNAPFGWCQPHANDDVGTCICMFGFNGEHCNSPWLFVFIIVGGFLALTLVSTLMYMCLANKTKASKQANLHPEEITIKNPYSELGEDPNGKMMTGKMRASVPDELNYEDRYEASSSF